MEREKNGFISNPTLFATLLVFIGLSTCLLIFMVAFGFSQILENPVLVLVIVLLLSFDLFFLLLIRKLTYRICFESSHLLQYKGNKLINKFNYNDIKMVFVNHRYGYVNIEGLTDQGQNVTLSFEYSKNRGNIISRYYLKGIENLPQKYK